MDQTAADLARIQTIAIAVTGAATVALVGVTAWYVWLTNRLVSLSQRQLTHLYRGEAQQRQAEAAVLQHRARRLREAVKRLPAMRNQHNAVGLIRAGVQWTREELRDTELLAGRLGPWFSGTLGIVVQHMESLALRVADVQAVSRSLGYDFDAFPWDEWEKAWDVSVRNLELIEKLASDENERQSQLAREAGGE